MTYEIETIEPSIQTLLESLAKLNLITFRRKSGEDTEKGRNREEVLAGWAENVREVRADMRGETQMKSAYNLLAELEDMEAL
jgi:hypothetical protein